jgi:hypothetical protein
MSKSRIIIGGESETVQTVASPVPGTTSMAAPGVLPRRKRGQALPLLALMMVVLLAFAGLALDTSMLILRTLQQQRAADGAALAGVVRLPLDEPGAQGLAREYAQRNGFTHNLTPGGFPQVTARQVPGYNTRLRVTIVAQHEVYFMHLFGIPYVEVQREAEATYALPVHLGCPDCRSFGVGNLSPIAAQQQYGDCPNCPLKLDKYWSSITGQLYTTSDGDPYNVKYGQAEVTPPPGGYNPASGCPGTVDTSPLNGQFRGSGIAGGYNYGVHVDPFGGADLTLYVYDPAQYYRSSGGSYASDTADFEQCPNTQGRPYRFGTTFRIYYDPARTTDYFNDDVLLNEQRFIDDGNTARNRWYSLGTLPSSYQQQYGDFRVQIVTDDDAGAGRNEYSLSLGGAREPNNVETIYSITNVSIYANLRIQQNGQPIENPEFYLTQIAKEHAGKQMEIRMFDPGDASCNVSVQVLKQDAGANTYSPYNFERNWDGNPRPSLPMNSCGGSPWSCTYEYQNGWVTLGVRLPTLLEGYDDSWWKIKYMIGGCPPVQATPTPPVPPLPTQTPRAPNVIFDRTTIDVRLLGNPIHIIPPSAP